VPILADKLQKGPTARWLELFRNAGVPAGPINTISEVLTDDYALERGLVRTMDHALGASMPTVANPVDFSRTPVCYGLAPPMRGGHTADILRDWLGYSEEQIEGLVASGAI
jgi:crotonobetainyl-CoA:carnitine CoA-transferase CaiB-like acyl-CoA transferase